MKAKTKRISKSAPRKPALVRFPSKRERLTDDEVNTWIEAVLAFGATFYVSYGTNSGIVMHTNSEGIAQDGLFNAFLAYVQAFPKQFDAALRSRVKSAASTVICALDRPSEALDFCMIVGQRS
jgi:hypothetical protein